jgi:hypothetical protein
MSAIVDDKIVNHERFGMRGTCRAGKKIAASLLFASVVGAGAFAQTAPAPAPALAPETKTVTTELIMGATLESVQKRIQGMGFDCTRGKDASGKNNTFVVFQAEGFKVVVFVPSARTVEVDTIFNDVHPSLATINEWNRDNRYSRAYLEKDGTVDLEDDLDLAAGITPEDFDAFIKTFRDSVTRWAHFVVEHEEKKQPATPGE